MPGYYICNCCGYTAKYTSQIYVPECEKCGRESLQFFEDQEFEVGETVQVVDNKVEKYGELQKEMVGHNFKILQRWRTTYGETLYSLCNVCTCCYEEFSAFQHVTFSERKLQKPENKKETYGGILKRYGIRK